MDKKCSTDKSLQQVFLLALANVLAYSSLPLMMLIGSLLGAELSGGQNWATLPIAMMIVGTALGILPATRTMQWLGRRPAFLLYSGLGVCASLLAAYSLSLHSFSLFCVAALLLGLTVSALQQIRFAAMELVELERAGTAASIIMCGGIIAAIIGPELAVRGRYLLAEEYQGAYFFAAAGFVLSGLCFAFYRPAKVLVAEQQHRARPLRQMLASPSLVLAVLSAAVGFAVMSFVMTGTPLSMHHHFGHSLEDTKWVLQSHIVAMFLPSLIAPWLFQWFGIRPLMLAGLVCYALTISIGVADTTVMGYWSQLVLLGVGWNFLFVGGTALLPSTYLDGEQFKAQAFNDTAVFSCQSVAALSAGWAINAASWATILLICLLPMALMLAALIWERSKNRSLPISLAGE